MRNESVPDQRDVANSQLTLAAAHVWAGRFAAARTATAAAVHALDDHPVRGDREVTLLRVRAIVALGNLDRILGQLDRARATINAAIQIAEMELGPDHSHTVGARDALAAVDALVVR